MNLPAWLFRFPIKGECRMVDTLPPPVECLPTQVVNRRRTGNYLTIHRMLLAETGMDLPAVKKLVGVE